MTTARCALSSAISKSKPKRERHGKRYTPEYSSWLCIKSRTGYPSNKNYVNYGARGIKICDEWKYSFTAFFNHIGPKPTPEHTIDRIDPDGNYEPGNVRWRTMAEQAQNKRTPWIPQRRKRRKQA